MTANRSAEGKFWGGLDGWCSTKEKRPWPAPELWAMGRNHGTSHFLSFITRLRCLLVFWCCGRPRSTDTSLYTVNSSAPAVLPEATRALWRVLGCAPVAVAAALGSSDGAWIWWRPKSCFLAQGAINAHMITCASHARHVYGGDSMRPYHSYSHLLAKLGRWRERLEDAATAGSKAPELAIDLIPPLRSHWHEFVLYKSEATTWVAVCLLVSSRF